MVSFANIKRLSIAFCNPETARCYGCQPAFAEASARQENKQSFIF
jgi:hypothetical protein